MLIAGGGTGWILEAIARHHHSGLKITYADPSARMIARAKKRNAGANQVVFITATAESLAATAVFDVIITPFLFDNFTNAGAAAIFDTIDARLHPGGLWLYADFQSTNSLFQRLLLKTMYLFFRAVAGVTAKQMPDMNSIFAAAGYQLQGATNQMNGFIVGKVYRKP